MQFFQDIHTWAKQRQLLDIEFCKRTQASFIAEEFSEFLRAKDESGEIDALCDMVVYATNAVYLIGSKESQLGSFCYGLDIPENLVRELLKTEKNSLNPRQICFEIKATEFLGGFLCSYDYDVLTRRLISLIAICLSYIEAMGFDVEIAMNETVKEINSRVGSLNELGKWEKDKSPEAMANWCKADYEKAKAESY